MARLPRWLAMLGAAALVGLAVALALLGVPGAISSEGDVFANLGKNLLTALVLGVVAYLWFYSWTSVRATRQLRQLAARSPELLFPIRPRIGFAARVVGRDDVIEDVASSLHSELRTGPLMIAGETGVGKTSFLLGLARYLAVELDVLPIVLSLRDLESIDFAELAKERFCDYIDPHLRTAEEAEKLWRWMLRRGKVVVLADDLDRARLPGQESDPSKTVTQLALAAARRRDLPLVVSSRPHGVPPDLDEPAIELGALELDPNAAAAYVLERAGRRGDAPAGELARAHISSGDLVGNAFYLGVLARLVRQRALPAAIDGGVHEVRMALLDAWRASLLGDRSVPTAEKVRREAALEALDRFAAARLVPGSGRAPKAGLAPDWSGPEVARAVVGDGSHGTPNREWADALHLGERLQVIELDDEDGSLRFAHDVIQAYFASRVLRHDEQLCRESVARAPDAPRVQLSLVLGAASGRDPAFCRIACDALLADAQDVTDEQRLLRASAAAEVAQAGGFHELDDRIAAECAAARRDGTPLAKRTVIDQLAGLAGEKVITALWEYVADDDYGVRWAAAEGLVKRASLGAPGEAPEVGVYIAGARAYHVLAHHFDTALARARGCLNQAEDQRPDDWDEEILPLKQMAWVLPALRTTTAGSEDPALARRVAGHLDELLDLDAAKVTRQRGLEASIAQGFKSDAQLNRDAPIADDALKLLDRENLFWYSQVNLLHAITLRAVGSGHPERVVGVVARFSERAEHPFVKAAAEFCLEGIREAAKEQRDLDRYVWEDEGVVVARRPRDLDPDVIQLVGDITVLLNLNETGDLLQRAEFGERSDVPFCMSQSRDRLELIDDRVGCHDCGFQLCPYRPSAGLSARREISRAFCRHQALHARHRTARRWGSQVKQGALRTFWTRYESQARL